MGQNDDAFKPVDCPCGSAGSEVLPEQQRRRIFISYGHDEFAALARRLKKDLETRGHEVWFDEDRLKPGEDWEAYIEEGLEWTASKPGRGRIVLLMTPHAVRRPDGFCLNEITRALQRNMLVIPIMVVWCEPPLSICRIHYLDMSDYALDSVRHERYEAKFGLLAEAVERDKLEFEGMHSRLLTRLNPISFEADIVRHHLRELFIGREWVFKEIDDWLADPNASRLFWIVGWPGTGKSAIAAYLCSQRREVVASHFCVFHTEKTDPRLCVCSIAYQLTTQLPPAYAQRLNALDLESLIKEGKDNAAALLDELIVQPLASENLRPPDRTRRVIVIDALDEATVGSRNELARILVEAFRSSKMPDWLRLIITSRPEERVEFEVQDVRRLDLDPARPESKEDIRNYLRRHLKPFVGGADVPPDKVDAIFARSEGVFLYVYWIRRELEKGCLSLDRVQEFPQGLRSAYVDFFERQFPDVQAYQSQVRPVLEVVAAAYDYLSESLLTELFDWKNPYKSEEFFTSVGSLFPRVGERLRPFHLSILDWLTNKAEAKPYWVDRRDGHRLLADYCSRKCERHIVENRPLKDQFRSSYAFRHGVRHLVESGRYADAVNLLDYLVRNEQKLRPDERVELDQFAKIITVALRKSPPDESEARQIAPKKLAALLKGLYMTEPLYGGIRLLLSHQQDWPEILKELMATDDYVLRHTISEVLADDYLETGQRLRLEGILKLIEHPDINYQELGSYALGLIYGKDPACIEPKYLNLLAEGETYPSRSVLGDLLLKLTLQDWGTDPSDTLALEGVETVKRVDPRSRF
jgi:hypothetical protein